jgi:hypothetical protein
MSQEIVRICNSALLKIGADRINSINEPGKMAELCKEQYDKIRKELLRSHPWNFSKKRLEIAATINTPLFDWGYEHQLPVDCLRVLSIDAKGYDFKVEGRKIVSDSPTLKIFYISDVTDATLFDANFSEVLALKLAKDIAYSITQSSNMVQMLAQEYERALSQARSFNAQEGTPDKVDASEWLNSRF